MKKTQWMNGLFMAVILAALLAAFANTMTSLNRNEHMYITAAALISQGKTLYKDFAYLQTPYLPLFYAGLFKLFGLSSFYLLIGKMVSFLALAASGLVLYFLARRVLKDTSLALGILALYVMNLSVVLPAREASNYILPVLLSLSAVWVFDIAFHSGPSKAWLWAVCGLLMALTVGVRLTYAAAVIPFFLVMALSPLFQKSISVKNLIGHVLRFTAGMVFGLLPLLIYWWSDPLAFEFNNLGYHTLNTQWRWMTGYTDRMSLSSKVYFAGETLLRLDNLILWLGVIFGGLASIVHPPRRMRLSVGFALGLLLFMTGMASALAPTPSFPQYYALPISFLFVGLVYSWSVNLDGNYSLYCKALAVMVLIVAIRTAPELLRPIPDLRDRENWMPFYVRDVSVRIRETLREDAVHSNPKVATLSPLFALEGGLLIYDELATGPFLYRVGDLLTAEQREHFVGSSPATIEALLDSDPPAAILIGFEGDLEQPLLEYALRENYRWVALPDFEGVVYVRSK